MGCAQRIQEVMGWGAVVLVAVVLLLASTYKSK